METISFPLLSWSSRHSRHENGIMNDDTLGSLVFYGINSISWSHWIKLFLLGLATTLLPLGKKELDGILLRTLWLSW